MALYKFFKRVDKDKIVKELKEDKPEEKSQAAGAVEKQSRKRGEYQKLSSEEKAVVGKYGSEHGVAAAVRHFKSLNVKESSVRGWKNAYEKELKERSKEADLCEPVAVPALPSKKRGRPPILGIKLDEKLQDKILSMRKHQAAVSSSIVIGLGQGLLLKHNKSLLSDFGGPITLNKAWAHCVLRRMGFTKRRGNSKSKLAVDNFENVKEQYLTDIRSVVKMEDIPDALILNWDQTAMKIVPSTTWTMERRGTKRVEIAACNDKRQITAVFACSLRGDFLPIQLIFQGTTQKCLPNSVNFPDGWHLTYTNNHWSNESTMIDYIKCIILPYVKETRETLCLASSHPALVLFDCFKGQCQESVFNLLDENNIFYILIPPNTTDRLQPLDLSVNKPAKDFVRSQFQNWYANIICTQLESGEEEPVDMRLSIMKPLMSQWIIEMYNYFQSHTDIVKNGFRAAGITDIIM